MLIPYIVLFLNRHFKCSFNVVTERKSEKEEGREIIHFVNDCSGRGQARLTLGVWNSIRASLKSAKGRRLLESSATVFPGVFTGNRVACGAVTNAASWAAV